jgi:hypothetical protein
MVHDQIEMRVILTNLGDPIGWKSFPQCRTKKVIRVVLSGEMQQLNEFSDSNGQPGGKIREIVRAIQPAPVDIMNIIFRGFLGPFVVTNKTPPTDYSQKCVVGCG